MNYIGQEDVVIEIDWKEVNFEMGIHEKQVFQIILNRSLPNPQSGCKHTIGKQSFDQWIQILGASFTFSSLLLMVR